ncbi:MAG: hypothetical protein K0Q95_3247 [Bacteroidota bacterium]|jgi:hypothetical protein|nr:hypothetical protein [Bacteroidota bacterium]
MKNLYIFFCFFYSFNLIAQPIRPNVLIDLIDIDYIDTTIKQNKSFALLHHIKEISGILFRPETKDSILEFVEQYDETGRIQNRKFLIGKSYYWLTYKYDSINRLSSFTKHASSEDSTKIIYNQENRVGKLILYNPRHYWTDSMYYYPNGKLKKVDFHHFFYDKNWNLTSVVYLHKNSKNDTVELNLYDTNGCLLAHFTKGMDIFQNKTDEKCLPQETYWINYGNINSIRKSFEQIDSKTIYEYERNKLVQATYYFYKKQLFRNRKKLTNTFAHKYSYYDNELLKTAGNRQFYYKYY